LARIIFGAWEKKSPANSFSHLLDARLTRAPTLGFSTRDARSRQSRKRQRSFGRDHHVAAFAIRNGRAGDTETRGNLGLCAEALAQGFVFGCVYKR
jgi:hypothetical protein